jgi:predicted transcriptional regulator
MEFGRTGHGEMSSIGGHRTLERAFRFGRQSDISRWQFETNSIARQFWALPFVCTKGRNYRHLRAFFLLCYTTPRSMKNFNTTSLGSLEEEIMQIIWKEKGVSVRFIFDKLKKKRPIAYTTVMTIMSRLHTKGILNRYQQDGAYIYSPAQSKEKFLEKISERVIKNLLNNFGDVAVAQFIDIIENSNYKSAELRKKLKNIK